MPLAAACAAQSTSELVDDGEAFLAKPRQRLLFHPAPPSAWVTSYFHSLELLQRRDGNSTIRPGHTHHARPAFCSLSVSLTTQLDGRVESFLHPKCRAFSKINRYATY